MMSIIDSIKSYGPGFSPVVIGLSAIVAYYAIVTQRDIARKRATFDLFIRTETDNSALDLWNRFVKSVEKYESVSVEEKHSFKLLFPDEYTNIRGYLNILELMASGLNQEVLDNKMCRNFFEEIVLFYYDKLSEFIVLVQGEPYSSKKYCEFVKVAERWKKESTKCIWS